MLPLFRFLLGASNFARGSSCNNSALHLSSGLQDLDVSYVLLPLNVPRQWSAQSLPGFCVVVCAGICCCRDFARRSRPTLGQSNIVMQQVCSEHGPRDS